MESILFHTVVVVDLWGGAKAMEAYRVLGFSVQVLLELS